MCALWPPVPDYPCAQVMPLMNMRKLIVKIYEALCCEFYAVSSSSRMRCALSGHRTHSHSLARTHTHAHKSSVDDNGVMVYE
jgi:hypothetical protein